MVRCNTLGALELRSSASEEHVAVLSQPKRAALLVYLAAATPRGLHRRDTLLALFWPELDQEHARAALRQSLTFLRHELGAAVIVTRGAEEVGIDPERLWCDVAALEDAIGADELERGMELYRGVFLAGFHLSGCGAFAEWVEQRRRELRDVAVDAVTRLITREEARGAIPSAVQWARRRAGLRPDDERALQRLLRLLDREGNRAGALREYDAFARRLAKEHQAEPSPETQVLIAAIRERGGSTVRPANLSATAAQDGDALEGAAAENQPLRAPARIAPTSRNRRRLALLGVAVIVVAAAFMIRRAARDRPDDAGADPAVVVMPFENRTGDSTLDPLGTVVAEWVTQGLTDLPFLTVLDTREAAAAAGTLGPMASPEAVRRETGAGVMVEGSYVGQGDSLQFQAQITSTAGGRILKSVSGVRTLRDRPMAGVERLRQRVLGGFASLHDEDVNTFAAALAAPPTYAAYRAYVEGVELYMTPGGSWAGAARRFLQAAMLDSTFLTPRIWAAEAGVMSSVVNMDEAWAGRADSLISGLEVLRDRLAPFDRARLDFVAALRAGDLLEAYQASLHLVDASPGSVDARREAAISAARVHRFRETLTRLEGLDPKRGLMRGFEPTYWAFVAGARHQLGQHEDELVAARRAWRLAPSVPLFQYAVLGALAALGRTRELDSAAAVVLPASRLRDQMAFGLAGELMAHGHADDGRRFARYWSRRAEAPPPSGPAAARPWLARDEWLHWRAELALVTGDVKTAASRAARLHDPGAYPLLLVRILAAQGKLGAARRGFEEWEGHMMQVHGTLHGLEVQRASALVSLGDREGALEVLSDGWGRWAVPNRTSIGAGDAHADPYLAPLFGDPRFQALIKPKG